MLQDFGLQANANKIFLIVLHLLLICSLYYTHSMKRFTKTDLNFQSCLTYTKLFLCLFLVTMTIYVVFVAKIILNRNRQVNVFSTILMGALAGAFAFLLCFYISSELGQIDPVTETEVLLDVSNFKFSINLVVMLQLVSLGLVLYQLFCEYHNPTVQENQQRIEESLLDLTKAEQQVQETNEIIRETNNQFLAQNAQQLEDTFNQKVKQIAKKSKVKI